MAKLLLTGDKQIDRILKRLADPTTTNKIVRNELRNTGAKPIAADARATVPVDSGAMKKAVTIKAGKRTRTGFKIHVMITRASLAKADPDYDPEGEGFYPAGIEWGDRRNHPGRKQAPMREVYDRDAAPTRERLRAAILARVMKVAKGG